MFQCDQCEKSFERLIQLNGHKIWVHSPKQECDKCHKLFGSNNLRKHKKVCGLIKNGICENCGKSFTYTKDQSSRFCSKHCSRAYSTKFNRTETTRKLKETNKRKREEREKTKIRYFCKECNTEIDKNKTGYCRKCWDKCPEERHIISKRVAIKMKAEDKFTGWQSRNILSYSEKFFIKVLTNNHLLEKCEINKRVSKKELGLNKNGGYFLDFFFKDKNIDLEIDGKQHLWRISDDSKRDQLLTANGYKVYRIKWKSIKSDSGKKYMKNEIDKFLEYRSVA